MKIGIVDAGFAQYGLRQLGGDLPSDSAVKTKNFCADFEQHVHGTGVAEVVHEVAPDAELHLICIEDAVDMAAAADYAIANGIHIVNQSGGFFNTSRGDGSGGPDSPDGIVARARAAGILWVASAGNSAKHHWSGTFVDADGDGLGEFAPRRREQRLPREGRRDGLRLPQVGRLAGDRDRLRLHAPDPDAAG